jgi:hypothetical protein
MYRFLKRSIDDLICLFIGETGEDYKPTKREYSYFWVFFGLLILFAVVRIIIR